MSKRNLMAGIGSSQTHDQVGWLVASRIRERPPSDCDVRLALTPADLLDWLQQYDSVHICDACSGNAAEPTVHRWRWPDTQLEQVAWGGTHDLNLPGVLQLATTLGMAPAETIIWGIEVPYGPCERDHLASIEPIVLRAAEEITRELQPTTDRCTHA